MEVQVLYTLQYETVGSTPENGSELKTHTGCFALDLKKSRTK